MMARAAGSAVRPTIKISAWIKPSQQAFLRRPLQVGRNRAPVPSPQPEPVAGGGSKQCLENRHNRDTQEKGRKSSKRSCFQFSVRVSLYHSKAEVAFYNTAFFFFLSALNFRRSFWCLGQGRGLAGDQQPSNECVWKAPCRYTHTCAKA